MSLLGSHTFILDQLEGQGTPNTTGLHIGIDIVVHSCQRTGCHTGPAATLIFVDNGLFQTIAVTDNEVFFIVESFNTLVETYNILPGIDDRNAVKAAIVLHGGYGIGSGFILLFQIFIHLIVHRLCLGVILVLRLVPLLFVFQNFSFDFTLGQPSGLIH